MSFVARSWNPFRFALLLTVVWGAGGFRPQGAHAQLSPAFTYQGQLQQSEIPENARCDFQFGLFAAVSGGTALGTQAVSPVTVTNGLFTVVLNDSNQLGTNAFSGSNRYLEVDVCCPTSCAPSYTTLSPRQQLTATPYSLFASTAGVANDVSFNYAASTSKGGAATNLSCSGCVTGSNLAAGTIQTSNLGFTPGTLTSITAGSGLSGGTITTSGTITNSGVLSVSAIAPLSVSSGQNPSVSLTGQVGLANGGTGASTPAGALSNLGAAASGANSDITSLLSNITFTGNVSLPESTATAGNILKGGVPFIHDFGTSNTFLGESAGNFAMTGGENTAMGRHALSANISGNGNTAVGYIALASNTSGWSNTGLGKEALVSNTTGGANTAVGEGSLDANATGSGNSAVGFLALEFNTTGTDNTAVGGEALRSNKPAYDVANCTGSGAPDPCCTGSGTGNCGGDDNTAVGASALADNTTGYLNTAVGYEALQNNATGADNTALGGLALYNNTTGTGNTAVGWNALNNSVGGSNNIAVGYSAGTSLTGSNNIDIGNAGVSGDANTIRIGTPGEFICTGTPPHSICLWNGGQSAVFIAGISGATSSGGVAVYVNGAGQLGTTTSSARFKEDIREIGAASGGLMQLRPVRFRYKKDIDPSGLEQYGLVAEEVAKVYPDLVTYDNAGRPEAVRYHFVNAMLLNEVQKQHHQLQDQAEEIRDLKARLAALESALAPRAAR